MAMLLCVLSSALPAEAVLNPQGLMPCCRAMMGMSAECHGNSCSMHRRARAKPPASVQHDPTCGEGHDLQGQEKTATTSQTPMQHAHSRGQAQAGVEHDHGAGVSAQNTSQSTSRQPSVEVASLSRPCPSDCCGTATSSFTSLRRPRHGGALVEVIRPRPPTDELYGYAPSGVIKSVSALRRSHPPRAPPTALHSRTA